MKKKEIIKLIMEYATPGPRGPKGLQGPAGPMGPPGITGISGPRGADADAAPLARKVMWQLGEIEARLEKIEKKLFDKEINKEIKAKLKESPYPGYVPDDYKPPKPRKRPHG